MQAQGTGLGSKHLYIVKSTRWTGSEARVLLIEGCWEAGVEQINGLELSWLRTARHRKRQKLTPNYWPALMSVCSEAGGAIRRAREQKDEEVWTDSFRGES